jgi:hypothetical protein
MGQIKEKREKQQGKKERKKIYDEGRRNNSERERERERERENAEKTIKRIPRWRLEGGSRKHAS